jgi:hypothetical protein
VTNGAQAVSCKQLRPAVSVHAGVGIAAEVVSRHAEQAASGGVVFGLPAAQEPLHAQAHGVAAGQPQDASR